MANQIDPNVYALSISLQLDAGAAFETLDTFSDNIVELEAKLGDAVNKSFSDMSKSLDVVSAQIGEINISFASLLDTSTQIQKGMEKSLPDVNIVRDVGEERLDNLQQEFDVLKDMFDLQSDLLKTMHDELDLTYSMVKGIDGITSSIRIKNQAHINQNDLVQSGTNLIHGMGNEMQGVMGRGISLYIIWRQIKSMVNSVWESIKAYDEETEKFVTTNYRAYGSQQQLLQSTRQLSMEVGIARDVAIEAYKVLADTRAPRDQIDKLAISISKAHRYTGVAIDTLGVYAQKVRLAGGDAATTDRQLRWMSDAMRKFGLNTKDVSTILGDTSINTRILTNQFGGAADTVEKFEQMKATLMGVAKEMGMSTDAANSFANALAKDSMMLAKFQSLAGIQINTMDDLQTAQVLAGRNINSRIQQLNKLKSTNQMSVQAYEQNLKTLADVYYGGSQDALMLSARVGELADQMGIAGNSAADFGRIMAKIERDALDPWHESNSTLSAQLRILNSWISAVIGTLYQLVSDSILPFIKVLNYLALSIGSLIGMFREFYAWLESIPVIGKVFSLLRWGAGFVVALAIAFVFLAGAIGSFIIAAMAVPNIFSRLATIAQGFGNIIVSISRSIGQSIVILLTALGDGLAALGASIRPVMVPLLALGGAFLMVGASAWLFSLAISNLVAIGWDAVPAFVGLAIGIALVGGILVGLGYAALGAAPGIAIVAAAFLAVGAAAYLTGLGLLYVGQGMDLLSNSLSIDLILNMFKLSAAIMALGLVGVVASPGLIVLAGVFLAMAVSASILSVALGTIAASAKLLSTDILIDASKKILEASFYLAAAGIIGTAASILLVAAGASLIVASAAIFLAGVTLVPAGVLLTVGASAMLIGSGILAAAGMLLFSGSVLLITGGVILVTASSLISGASITLSVSAIVLSLASVELILASAAISIASIGVGVAGTALIVAGGILAFGAMSMYYGASMLESSVSSIGLSGKTLADAGSSIETAGAQMQSGVASISSAVHDLYDIVTVMNSVGRDLVPSSYYITIGMKWLGDSLNDFDRHRDKYTRVAKSMSNIASAFTVINEIPVHQLKSVSSEASASIAELDRFAVNLVDTSLKLSAARNTALTAVRDLDSYATAMAAVSKKMASSRKELGDIGEYIAILEATQAMAQSMAAFNNSIGDGSGLSDIVTRATEDLNKYADLIERTADRVNTAIMVKAIPAMKAAQQAGLSEAVKSEAISTVQVFDKREGNTENNDQIRLLEQQVKHLDAINGLLATLTKVDNQPVIAQILTLLETFLPNLNKGEDRLSSEMNGWGG